MSSGDYINLKQFSAPVCNKCGEKAIIYIDDNNGCDDPECGCGGYYEFAVIICENCDIRETLS